MTLNNKEVIAVEVPDDACGFFTHRWYSRKNETLYTNETSPVHIHKPLPEGFWELLGRANEITEGQARELVGGNNGGCDDTMWMDYESKPTFFLFTKPTALESFQSWLRANNSSNEVLLIKK